MVNNFETRLDGIAIHCRHRAEPDKIHLLFELCANGNNLRRFNFERQLAAVMLARDYSVGNQHGGRKFS
jgi:hypothetical protein